jgi:hypothetical protein
MFSVAERIVSFYGSVLSAGSIIAGFCGLFLLFRIQREADFLRQPGKLHYQQHFTSSMFLIILATICAFVFGVWFPLLGLAGSPCPLLHPPVIVGGLIGASLLLAAYVLDELVHYEILFPPSQRHRLSDPARARGHLSGIIKLDSHGFFRSKERYVWVFGIVGAAIGGYVSYCYLSGLFADKWSIDRNVSVKLSVTSQETQAPRPTAIETATATWTPTAIAPKKAPLGPGSAAASSP